MTAAGPSLPERFLRGLARSPDRDAIRDRGRAVTYAQLHELALCWAGNLLHACDEPPTAIGVLAGKGVVSYAGVLAALYCGVPAVPLQPDFPVSRTQHMLAAANVSALIADEHGHRLLTELGDARPVPVLLAGQDGATSAAASAPAVARRPGFRLDEPRPVAGSAVAYILFTSGSTGRPKGVQITHANLAWFFAELEARYGFDPDDVFSQVFDPAFDCAIFDLFAAWGAGATLVSVPPGAYRAMTDFVTESGITVWYSTPAAISVVARRGGLAAKSMPTLRLSTFAGDALKAADAAAWQQAAPEAILDNLYGPAETTITCTVYRWSPDASPSECLNDIVPIGRLHSGHEYLLRGHADGNPSTLPRRASSASRGRRSPPGTWIRRTTRSGSSPTSPSGGGTGPVTGCGWPTTVTFCSSAVPTTRSRSRAGGRNWPKSIISCASSLASRTRSRSACTLPAGSSLSPSTPAHRLPRPSSPGIC